MENKRWLDNLSRLRNWEPECDATPVNPPHPFYLVEGLTIDNSETETLLVCDCTLLGDDDAFPYEDLRKCIDENNEPLPVIVFRNWDHERKVYWNFCAPLSLKEKSEFTCWFEKKFRFM